MILTCCSFSGWGFYKVVYINVSSWCDLSLICCSYTAMFNFLRTVVILNMNTENWPQLKTTFTKLNLIQSRNFVSSHVKDVFNFSRRNDWFSTPGQHLEQDYASWKKENSRGDHRITLSFWLVAVSGTHKGRYMEPKQSTMISLNWRGRN